VRSVVDQVAVETKLALAIDVLAPSVAALLKVWPREIVTAVAVQRMKALRNSARNPSRYLAADLSRVNPESFALPEELRELLVPVHEDADDQSDRLEEQLDQDLDALLDRLRPIDRERADDIDKRLDRRLMASTEAPSRRRAYSHAIRAVQEALAQHLPSRGGCTQDRVSR
jgi:hypothetical protein